MTDGLSGAAMGCVRKGAALAFGAPALWGLGFLYGMSAILMRSALGGLADAIGARAGVEMLSCVILFVPACAAFVLSAAGLLFTIRGRLAAGEEAPQERAARGYWGLALRLAALAPVFGAVIAAVLLPGSLIVRRLPMAAIAWTAASWFAAGCFLFLAPAILAADSSGVRSAVAGAARFLASWARFYRVLGIVMLFMIPARAANIAIDSLARAAGPTPMNWVLMALSSMASGMAVAGILAALMRFYAAQRPQAPA